MKGMKHFIIGFGLSLFSVSLSGQLYSSASVNKLREHPKGDIKIDLYKTPTPQIHLNQGTIFADIKKQSQNFTQTEAKENNIPSPALAYEEVNGIEDDEILQVNVEDIIPIEYFDSDDVSQHAEVLHEADDDIVAMLPAETNAEEDFAADNPWVVAKGSKHIKNKKLLEQYAEEPGNLQLSETINASPQQDEEISYKVAEKIKQSIIFPIPNEILNDENLVPTFIQNEKKGSPKNKKQSATKNKNEEPMSDALKIIPKVPTQEENKNTSNSSSILNSLSSWFSEKPDIQAPAVNHKQTRAAPLYSSQETSSPKTRPVQNINNNAAETDEFVKFYETLQQTTQDHEQNRILPSELKLSFQPGRAEISGQTLHWLKAFSESTKDGTSYLQVRLDASAPVDLQKRRLSLLYTIFMNNGVDLKQVDTVFSLNEPNAFIIRTLKYE